MTAALPGELAPCPHCGGEAKELTDYHAVQGNRFWIVCGNPECRVGHKMTQSAARSSWNRRALLAADKPVAQPVEQESAWLIEMPEARWGTGYLWCGLPSDMHEWGALDEAVRFSREEDAERIIAALERNAPRYRTFKLQACEHMWPAASPPSGMALVPQEPTEEMVEAGGRGIALETQHFGGAMILAHYSSHEVEDANRKRASAAYRAMLRAAGAK